MYCQKCGKQIADGSVFCQHCGAQIGNVVSDNFLIKIIMYSIPKSMKNQ